MIKFYILLFVQLFYVQFSWSVTDESKSLENPASVSGTLQKKCEVVNAQLSVNWEKIIQSLPFVSKTEKKSAGKWIESSRTQKDFSADKTSLYSVNSTVPSEFPLTLIKINENKFQCLQAQDAMGNPCLSSYGYTIEGSQAIVYRKTVGFNSNNDYLSSFTLSISLNDMDETSCSFMSTLSINNSKYLWAKKHLIGELKPEQIEQGIFNQFAFWSESLMNNLEVGQ